MVLIYNNNINDINPFVNGFLNISEKFFGGYGIALLFPICYNYINLK